MAMLGLALAMVGSVSLRQQRVFADLSDQSALANQLREATSVLPVDLRSIAAAEGDVRDARDTALEIRSTIGTAIVCDTIPGAVVLTPVGPSPLFTSLSTSIEAGDSAWIYRASSSAWQGHRVTAVANRAGAPCAARAPTLTGPAASASRIALSIAPAPASPDIGAPLRITRPLRYSLYKASDNNWYAGERDWSNSLARFNTIQPVAGPFLAASSGGLAFRYLDSAGSALATPVAATTAIVAIRVTLRGQTRANTRALGAATSPARHADSSIMTIALHNRR
jgi:hypothetical protein